VGFRLRLIGTSFSLEGDEKISFLLQLFSSKISPIILQSVSMEKTTSENGIQ